MVTMKQVLFLGTVFTGLRLLFGMIMYLTKGLFLARLPQEFKKDLVAPQFEQERQLGRKFIRLVFTYVPPIFLFFLVGFLCTYIWG
jgi:hypothetical protein